jgi:hypothetical protein
VDCGPFTSQEFTKWDKHQIETLHAEFCKKAAVGRPGSPEKTGYVLTDPQNEVETELHFLISYQVYDRIRETYFPQITQTHKEFENKSNFDKLPYILVEIPQCAITAARFVTCCHKKSEEQTPL